MTPEEPCKHLEVIRDYYPGWQYDYCPKCGERTMTPEEPCKHLEVIRDYYPGWQYDYCPKCGERTMTPEEPLKTKMNVFPSVYSLDVPPESAGNSIDEELRLKHSPLELSQGQTEPVRYCRGCAAPGGSLNIKWPCDLIQFLDYQESLNYLLRSGVYK